MSLFIGIEAKRVEVYRFVKSLDVPVGSYGAKQKFSSPLFPGLTINVAKVFAYESSL